MYAQKDVTVLTNFQTLDGLSLKKQQSAYWLFTSPQFATFPMASIPWTVSTFFNAVKLSCLIASTHESTGEDLISIGVENYISTINTNQPLEVELST